MKSIFSFVILATIVASGQETPKNIWQAQELAKKIFENHPGNKGQAGRSAENTQLALEEPYVVLRSNLGEFSNASPAVEIRMDVVKEYASPVFVSTQVSKWTGAEYTVQGYAVPEAGLYGVFEKISAQATYVAYRANFPEAEFGDTYIFSLAVFDQSTGQVIQRASTRFMVGGDGFGHRSPYHLDGAVYQNGYLYLKGSFKQVPKVWIRLGDPRSNSTGVVEGKVVSDNLIVAPLNLPMVNNYAFPYDVVLHIGELGESYTLPGGLKLDTPTTQAIPAPPPISTPQK